MAKPKPVTVVRHRINRNALNRIVNKAVKRKFEFIAINSPPNEPELFNVVACEKMWDDDMEDLFNMSRNTVKPKTSSEESEKPSMAKKNNNNNHVDMSELNPKALMKAIYNEEQEAAATKEVIARLERVQAAYSLYNPDDKFRTKGDIGDLSVSALIKTWDGNNEKLAAQAEDMVMDWLNLDAKISGMW